MKFEILYLIPIAIGIKLFETTNLGCSEGVLRTYCLLKRRFTDQANS